MFGPGKITIVVVYKVDRLTRSQEATRAPFNVFGEGASLKQQPRTFEILRG
jgi:hypothetical protein